jgi:hypothetical protein
MKTAGKKIVEFIMNPSGRPGAYEVELMIDAAIADARAAGYAEAIEKTAGLAATYRVLWGSTNEEPGPAIASAIVALGRAATGGEQVTQVTDRG